MGSMKLRAATEPASAGGAACPFCKETDATIRYDLGTHRIARCPGCELMYLDPWPTESELREVYASDYFQTPTFFDGGNASLYGYVDYIAERLNKQGDYVPIARKIRARLNHLSAVRLLEVGCGFGYFLDVAFDEGFQVAGLEFNDQAVQRLRQKYSFPIHSGSLKTAQLARGSYDAVLVFARRCERATVQRAEVE